MLLPQRAVLDARELALDLVERLVGHQSREQALEKQHEPRVVVRVRVRLRPQTRDGHVHHGAVQLEEMQAQPRRRAARGRSGGGGRAHAAEVAQHRRELVAEPREHASSALLARQLRLDVLQVTWPGP